MNWDILLLMRLLHSLLCLSNVRSIVHDMTLTQETRCAGSLGKYASCQCLKRSVTCINTQLTDTDVFLLLDRNHYKGLREVTFHGNNFVQLPFSPLFGSSGTHSRLQLLNISANYIVNLHSEALGGMPNLHVLDLSNNEIVLKEEDVHFLSRTRRLRKLYLRRAFNQSVNRTIQFDLIERLFETARLISLIHLDLSYNFFSSVPYNLGCHLPALTSINLAQNLLTTLSINTSCLDRLETLDLRRNLMHSLTGDFRLAVASNLPDYSLQLQGNRLYCDCSSRAFIGWLKSSSKVRDKAALRCSRASPPEMVGHKLIHLSVDKLDCLTDLTTISQAISNIPHSISSFYTLVVVVVVYFLCPLN